MVREVSNHLISTTYKRELRTPMRKSVMALFADKASDDGSGIYASKQTMADELCCSKQAILDTIKAFMVEGLLIEVRKRRVANGFTVEYGIVVEALEALPLVKCHADKLARQSSGLTGQPNGPVKQADRSTGLTPPVQQVDPNPPEPSSSKATPSSRRERSVEPKAKPFRMPIDWKPVRFADDSVAQEIITRRGRDWGRAALESFRNWAANADDKDGIGRKLNWQQAWGKWVIEQESRDGQRPSNGRVGGNGQSRSGHGRTVDAAERFLARRGLSGSEAGTG
ncbi:hypothetical protein [Sphingomonas sp. PP-CC-3A-396]|uniref:hypothetical protein n=1 Tax=Sphingomonas sp. PP-CC-3A-396 TaxID=2135655 RepID=UPI0014044F05|nr:hypothetical protein [Sphingomonas sp. PP-CC-3A-396]